MPNKKPALLAKYNAQIPTENTNSLSSKINFGSVKGKFYGRGVMRDETHRKHT